MKRAMSLLLGVSLVGTAGWLSLAGAPVVKPGTPLPPAIQEIVTQHCLPCHGKSAFFKTIEGLKASEARSKLKAGKMPPKKSPQAQGFEGIERSTLLDFLASETPSK